jgi:hypothetical protein
MAKSLSATQIVTLLTQPVGNLKRGDLDDLVAALNRIPDGTSHGDTDAHRTGEKTVGTLLAGGFGAAS